MRGLILDIGSPNRHLSVERGFLVASSRDQGPVRTPLADVEAVIASSFGLTLTSNCIASLAANDCLVVFCGENFQPTSVLLPYTQHHLAGARLSTQLRVRGPLKKRLWQRVVRAKLRNQSSVIYSVLGHPIPVILRLVESVRPGDPSNVEGRAARYYWRALFGPKFRRDPELPGLNGMLNYGYSVLRSLVARYIVASGLHPNISLHHSNEASCLRLADDVMEPYRPLVDMIVKALADRGSQHVDQRTKPVLAGLAAVQLVGGGHCRSVARHIERSCYSLVEVYGGLRKEPSFPVFESMHLKEGIDTMLCGFQADATP